MPTPDTSRLEATPAEERGRRRRLRLAAILLVAALPRIWAAAWDQGIFWADEIYQSLEPAHRFAFGFGFEPWEYRVGARSWLFPGTLGIFWKLLAGLGVDSGPTLVIAAKLLMAAVGVAGVYAAIRIAETLAGSEAAVLAGVLAALFPPALVFGGRCMAEMVSGTLYAAAALLALRDGRWKLVLSGCLAGLGVFLRYQNGLLAAALLGWLLVERRRAAAVQFAVGALLSGTAGGLLDLAIWGTAFHSFLTYARFHLAAGRSAQLGIEPITFYAQTFWRVAGLPGLLVVVGAAVAGLRSAGLVAVVAFYVLAHSLFGHKEFRYLMPVTPLLLALGGTGLGLLLDRVRKRREPNSADRARGRSASASWESLVLASVLAAAMLRHTAGLSFDDFGQGFGPLSGTRSVWHAMEPVNRLLWDAGRRSDLCGLALVGYDPVWTGGYTYFHRDVPILWQPPIESEPANYVLAPAALELPDIYATVRTLGDAKLARRAGDCAPPPASYTRRFPEP